MLRSPNFCHFIVGGMKLDPCVSAVVIGFQSVDDVIKPNQFNFIEGESKFNYFKGDQMDLSNYLVSHFCSPGGTVLDLSGDPEGCNYA